MQSKIPIEVGHLFLPLEEKLISLLESLTPDDWNKPTLAKLWTVKDITAHLLDSNVRALSMQRDKFFGETPPQTDDYRQLVDWLNQLNAIWVRAAKRISPEMLILLHKNTGSLTSEYFQSLDPWDEAIFPVDWAGESKSYNWMHLAREYTEKWHHQQQIREATGKPGIMTERFFRPLINTYFMALPYTFKGVEAETGTKVQIAITGELGGNWLLTRTMDSWKLSKDETPTADSVVAVPTELSWKLFSKNIRPTDVSDRVKISGDATLGKTVLEMVSVMA
ncbi:MAG: maleylpyruvate isomerase N-terminal domain-containing protein [Cyclobacteriaceae bacterium]